jgi:hypothetical protein
MGLLLVAALLVASLASSRAAGAGEASAARSWQFVSPGDIRPSFRDLADKARDPIESLHLNAWLFNEMLVRTSTPRVGSIFSQRNEFNLQASYVLNEHLKLYTWIRPFYDSIYDWGGGSLTGRNGATLHFDWQDDMSWDNEKDPVFREAYADVLYGNFWGRFGRQIIAWGKSDGIFILDNISPFNYREPLRFQEQEIKIPQWMLNFNYRFGTFGTAQLIWIPKVEFAAYPGQGPLKRFTGTPNCEHDLEFSSACLVNQLFVAFDDFFKANGIVGANGQVGYPFPNTRKPPSRLENSAVMGRFDSSIGQLNYSLAYEYKYNWFLQDLPDAGNNTPLIGKGTAAQGLGNIRVGQRIHIIGGAFDYQFPCLPPFGESTVMRVETAMFLNDLFFLPDTSASEKNHYQVMIGFDKFFTDPEWLNFPKLGLGPSAVSWFFSVQVFSDFIIRPDRWKDAYWTSGTNNFDFDTLQATNGLRDATQQYVTVFLGKDLLADQTLNLEQFVLIDPNFGNVWEHIQFKYMVSDFVSVAIGYNRSWGRESEPFGSNPDYMWTQFTFGI